ncbi:hypothetical protein [Enteractinococcus coprophilus]|uniref:Uncharacterized protein n=1 Tax=Enteractinococcus coprophilus TaxID=1027633 RepID=A0A543AFF6_9MICC|nr:hypothetical protein [Enteractinococcus coprophilus]TQL71266.1 hypothetical protein FB556_1739 [Enteractinococcus coprophilus]
MTFNPVPPPPPPHVDHLPAVAKKSRKWPWVLGIVGAFVLGGAAGYGGTPEPEIVTKEVEVEPADIDERRSVLDEREDDLDQRSSELDERSSDLEGREEELQTLASELDERDEALTATEQEIEENTIPGSGIYLIGEDIKPGTYRSDGSRCYWARLSGTSGEFEHIIANDNVEGTAYVTIAESDVAFETSRCGEWKLQ